MDLDLAVSLRIVIGRLWRELNASATGEGLTPSQASTLGLVAGRGPFALAEIIRIEGLNPTMVSRIVSHLDEQGFIRRVPNPDDLRTVTIHITPTGLATHERIREKRARVVAGALARLSVDERNALAAAIPALEALVAELGGPTTP